MIPAFARIAALLLVCSMSVPGLAYGQPNSAAARQPVPCRTFVETGKTVCNRFLQYWESNGGLAQQGYPVSGEFREQSDVDGKMYTMQYFERAVFELHPENKPPYDVLLSLLGSMAYKAKYPAGRASGEIKAQPSGGSTGCSPTYDDSDAGVGNGFEPEAPERNKVGSAHTVSGIVLSSDGCLPLANAKLEMRPDIGGAHPQSQWATLYTDAGGRYTFQSDQPAHIHMRISANGFRTIIANQYHPSPGQTQGSFDIVLVPDPACRLFKETGQRVCGAFLDYWNKNGGLAQQGYPISDEFTEKSAIDGRTYRVQYFERAVFELHPENKPPYNVLLSHLGLLRLKAKYAGREPGTPAPTAAADPYAALRARPLRLPVVAPGQSCPKATGRMVAPSFGPALGSGPLYPVGLGTEGMIDLSGALEEGGWLYAKVLWIAAPTFRGPALVRGGRLGAPGEIRFERGAAPANELKLQTEGRTPDTEGWIDWPAYTRLRGPGCYAYQVDAPGFTLVIPFEAK